MLLGSSERFFRLFGTCHLTYPNMVLDLELCTSVTQQFTWYFPSQMLRNPPSLSKAYAYYEHITLPRYYVGEYRSGHIMRRAEPGECVEQTEMYPVWVPSTSLIEWGIGVDQYFSTVRFFAFILFAAGLLLLPNIRFFASTEYSPEGKDVPNKALLGTAICGTNEWVVCTECNPEVFRGVAEGRVLVGDDGTVLILRTLCNGGELLEGMINWVVLVFLIVVVTLTSLYLRAREVRFDEDKYVLLRRFRSRFCFWYGVWSVFGFYFCICFM